ncbi:hypothetical protein ACFFOM_11945 [Microlunatus capsulatus]|uniref:Uncharacterized protein n=1 Tax=Microlunatus capsulatus TaxID=99117 RepID=A0ABS4Z975_9ACTN|nr:hypothetical protein [Microlunatus capsulatus]MBP2417544.1 hypothetical protein [Microlunatus capsulatus]
MSLRERYAEAWARRRGLGPGWLVNLEPTYNLDLGAVGVVSGLDFQPETTLALRGVPALQEDPTQQRADTPWQFQSNDEIALSVESSGKLSGLGGAIGAAGWDVTVSFGRQAGASLYGKAMWWRGYADVGVVRAAVVAAARDGQLHKGESIVIAQQLTGAGVLFTAEGSNATLRARASADVSPTAVPEIASLAGKLSVVQSSAGAQLQAFADGAVLAGRILYLGYRGWFWWRQFEAYGAFDVDPDQVEETILRPVEGDGADEYFALV